jgi:hypothetical protein
MNQKIRITTRANQFERRKQEHLRAGYLIEDEQPIPMNGFCSFTAVRILQANPPSSTPEMPPDQTNK